MNRRAKSKYVAMAVGGGYPLLLAMNEGFSAIERSSKGCYEFTYEEAISPLSHEEVIAVVHQLPPGIMASLESGPYACIVRTFKIGRKTPPRDASFRLEVIRAVPARRSRS